MRTTMHWIVGLLVLAIGGAITWLMVALTSSPLFVTGTTPATIWGGDIGSKPIAVGAGLLLAAAAWCTGKLRFYLILVWLLFLASATHRLVERSDGEIRDQWFTITVQRLEALPGYEPSRNRCDVGRWLARCADGSGGILYTGGLVPFAQLYPGRWTEQP
ncbi:MAG: hypothetical protein DI629_13250 [Mesorhizobium amorphae]|nr:MAG: hypothetical protein DI629_13250 [Mesorhizobium amorphae]